MGAKRKLGRQEIQKEHTGGVTTLRWATSLHVLTSSGSLPTRQVQMFGGRHSSRCWACSFSFLCPSTIIHSSIICLGLRTDVMTGKRNWKTRTLMNAGRASKDNIWKQRPFAYRM